MKETNPKVDAYLRKAERWQDEMKRLRTIVLDCELTEEFKWRQPCYMSGNRIVLLISAFKGYCALAFFKGVLLKDRDGILVAPGENSQAMRQIRFTDVRGIVEMEPVLKRYVREAIAVEEAGLKVKKHTELAIPEELQKRLDENPALKTAFEALTPGRRRAYVLHFSAAKQAKTRESRVERWTQHILDGKGMNDR